MTISEVFSIYISALIVGFGLDIVFSLLGYAIGQLTKIVRKSL